MDDVVNWAEQFVPLVHALKLKEQEVNGKSLLQQTKMDLRSYGIPGGPASILADEIQRLKGPTQGYHISHRVLLASPGRTCCYSFLTDCEYVLLLLKQLLIQMTIEQEMGTTTQQQIISNY